MSVKNIFMNCECPLLEISTNENKNVSCGIIPSDGGALKSLFRLGVAARQEPESKDLMTRGTK